MKKLLNIIFNVIKIILTIFILLFIIYDAALLIQKYAMKRDMPVFFGYSTAVVASDSMYPEFSKGDLVIIDVGAEYTVEDVVTYYDASSGMYITHRIIEQNADGTYTTKGDNNDSPDSEAVTDEMIFGKVVAVWGGIGTVIDFLQEPMGIIIVILAAALIVLFFYIISKILTDLKDDEEEKE